MDFFTLWIPLTLWWILTSGRNYSENGHTQHDDIKWLGHRSHNDLSPKINLKDVVDERKMSNTQWNPSLIVMLYYYYYYCRKNLFKQQTYPSELSTSSLAIKFNDFLRIAFGFPAVEVVNGLSWWRDPPGHAILKCDFGLFHKFVLRFANYTLHAMASTFFWGHETSLSVLRGCESRLNDGLTQSINLRWISVSWDLRKEIMSNTWNDWPPFYDWWTFRLQHWLCNLPDIVLHIV